ncbi:hypothetical protein ACJJTC_010067 [Scirpophaga incertulas]
MRLIDTFVILVCLVVQCSAMTLSELEDFTNFLKKTSQLDETLKKGTDPHEFDEDEIVSDHAWEESGKFEGDLILNDRQRRMIVEEIAENSMLARNGLKDSTKRWPDNEVIYYIQKEHFNEDQVQAIQSGIEDIAMAACVKFRPYRKGDRDAVVIQGNRRGCFSQVGYQGGYQVLNLSGRHPVGRGCFRHGTVVHELLHTLGFYHMQSSPDRDDYVKIVWENVVRPARHNFRKYNAFAVSDFGVGYDYDSVLHYSRRAFSSNGKDTIVPKQDGAQIGQRTGLSDKDTQKLNKMYCDADSNDEVEETTTKSSPVVKSIVNNEPFEGHGIGYHQGKTVVIKLLPNEKKETYPLVHKPEFHLFDYFSKTPQALPKKKVENNSSEKSLSSNTKKTTFNEYNNSESDIKPDYKTRESLDDARSIETEKFDVDGSLDYGNVNNYKLGDKKFDFSINVEDELNEAFDRLSKIIKTHVYPSHTLDFKAYKINLDKTKNEAPTENKKKAQKFQRLVHKKEEGVKKEQIDVSNTKKKSRPRKNKKIRKKGKRKEPKLYEVLTSTDDSSHRTSYPFKIHKHISNGTLEIKTPAYATNEKLKNLHDYTDLYQINKTAENGEVVRKHQLFGDFVPVYTDWYINEKVNDNPVNYDEDLYSSPNKYRANYDYTGSDSTAPVDYYTGSYSPRMKEAYKIFDAPVPLTRDWYKVNRRKLNEHYPYDHYHHPSSSSYSVDSHENNR